MVMSAMVFVLISRYLISLYLAMTGNNLSISFYAMDSLLYARDLLFAVFPSPVKAPFNAYYSFLRSSSAFILAYSYSFFLYSSFNRYYSSFCFNYYWICSQVFSGGGGGTYSWGSSDIQNSIYIEVIQMGCNDDDRLFIMGKIFIVLLGIFALGFAATDWTQVDHIIEDGISQGLFSGCTLAVATVNSTLLKKPYGTITPKRGFYAPPVTLDMKWDLNYLTQVIATNSMLMEGYDQGKWNTTTRAAILFFDFNNNGKGYVTLQNLLEHNSGLQAAYTAAYPKTPTQLLKAINNLKLEYKTQANFTLSELNPIVLGQVILKVKNTTSYNDALFTIMTIANMRDTSYTPSTVNKYKIVPSGYHSGYGIAQGVPSNRITHFLNNTSGAAGAFSTVDNVLSYMQLMLNRGKLPLYNTRVFSQEVVDRFLNLTTYKLYKNTRVLGWETVPAVNPPCGKKFSPSPYSFGLADPSGSYVWADKKRNVTIIFLANGNFPVNSKVDPSIFQGTLSDAVMTALGY